MSKLRYAGKSISAADAFDQRSMSNTFVNGHPSPEEFQRQLSEFVRQHFQSARAPATAAEDSAFESTDAHAFEFRQKPREVKAYLDRFVIKQDEAKKVLSVALCDHYHHVRLALEGKESP